MRRTRKARALDHCTQIKTNEMSQGSNSLTFNYARQQTINGRDKGKIGDHSNNNNKIMLLPVLLEMVLMMMVLVVVVMMMTMIIVIMMMR